MKNYFKLFSSIHNTINYLKISHENLLSSDKYPCSIYSKKLLFSNNVKNIIRVLKYICFDQNYHISNNKIYIFFNNIIKKYNCFTSLKNNRIRSIFKNKFLGSRSINKYLNKNLFYLNKPLFVGSFIFHGAYYDFLDNFLFNKNKTKFYHDRYNEFLKRTENIFFELDNNLNKNISHIEKYILIFKKYIIYEKYNHIINEINYKKQADNSKNKEYQKNLDFLRKFYNMSYEKKVNNNSKYWLNYYLKQRKILKDNIYGEHIKEEKEKLEIGIKNFNDLKNDKDEHLQKIILEFKILF